MTYADEIPAARSLLRHPFKSASSVTNVCGEEPINPECRGFTRNSVKRFIKGKDFQQHSNYSTFLPKSQAENATSCKKFPQNAKRPARFS
jgi:hypothetical protein